MKKPDKAVKNTTSGPSLLSIIFNRDILPYSFELILVSFFINLLALATPIFVLQVYDRVIFHAGLTTLQGLLIGMLIVIIFDALLKINRIRFFQAISAKNDQLFSQEVFKKIFHLPLKTLEEKPLWYWQSLFQDTALIRNVLGGATAALLVDIPFSLLFLSVTIIIAPSLWWVFVIILLLFIALALFSEKIIHQLSLSERQIINERDTSLTDLLGQRESVKMMALEEYWQKDWEKKHQAGIDASITRGKSVDFYRVISQSMSLIFTVSLTSVGALAIINQEMTIGSLIAANMLGSRLIAPFVQLVEQWRTLTQFNQALKRIDSFIRLPEDKSKTQIELPAGAGKIQLDDIQFSYKPEANPAIYALKGSIGPNGLHIIMGKNGCGKSTLLKLLSGFYQPDKGVINLDEYDIQQFSTAQLHQRIAYLAQKPELFQCSIYDNIAAGSITSTDNDIIEVSKIIQLHELITALPEGYDTIVKGGHQGLSGGLVQRIALARTLLGKTQIVLMDEPTNNLDEQAEQSLIKQLKRLSATHTIIVATHCPALVTLADSIIVLDKGKVALAGPAKQVIEHLKKTQA